MPEPYKLASAYPYRSDVIPPVIEIIRRQYLCYGLHNI